jgi:hypothetical protein
MVDAACPAPRSEEAPEAASLDGAAVVQAEARVPDPLAEVERLADLDSVTLELELPSAARRLSLSVQALRRAVAEEGKRRRAEHAAYEVGERARRAGNGADGGTAAVAEEAPAPVDPRGRTDLFVDLADLPDTAAELADRLAALPHLFDRGGPARLAFDVQRGGMVAEPLTLHGVVTEAHSVCRPWQWRRVGRGALERVDVTLPERVAKLYLDRRGRWGLRPLDGVAPAPLLSEDGGMRVADGYDPATRLWCERMPAAMAVPDAPTRAEAEAALRRLRVVLRTFAFADAPRVTLPGCPVPAVDVDAPPEADESAALAMLMTAVCRPSLWKAPGLMARAPAFSGAGTGKGLLVRVTCAVAFGRAPRAVTPGGTAEELEKRIASALMRAEPVLFLDNANGLTLKSDALASALTERPAEVRALGGNRMVALNPVAFVAVTGNGLAPSEDLARRFVVVELDAGVEDPDARDFPGDLLGEVSAQRGELLADALTIWRWGRRQGAALPKGRALGSFEQWGRWCRDALLALGCRDPVLRVAEAKADDPRRRAVAAIFDAWWEHHRDHAVTANGLHDAVKGAADPAAKGRQYLASRIRNLEGTRAAGFVLTRTPVEGRWSPDSYRLLKTDVPSQAGPTAAAGHRDHGGHREGTEAGGAAAAEHWGPAAPDSNDPYDPYASTPGDTAGADDRIFEGEL